MIEQLFFCPYCNWQGKDPKPKTGENICPRCLSWRVEPVIPPDDKQIKKDGKD